MLHEEADIMQQIESFQLKRKMHYNAKENTFNSVTQKSITKIHHHFLRFVAVWVHPLA